MIKIEDFRSVDYTLLKIYYLVFKHFKNNLLKPFDTMPLKDVFDYIAKKIKYVKDIEADEVFSSNAEVLKAPHITLLSGSGDCDCKHILAAAIMKRKEIPFRFVITSTKPNKKYHHIYLEINLNDEWIPFDATYPQNEFLTEKPFTAKKVFVDEGNKVYAKAV